MNRDAHDIRRIDAYAPDGISCAVIEHETAQLFSVRTFNGVPLAFFSQLFPGYRVEHELLERSRLLLAEVEAEPLLARMLREANDDLERAIRCREFARAQG